MQDILAQVDRNAWTADVVHAINRSYTESNGAPWYTDSVRPSGAKDFNQVDVNDFQSQLKFALKFHEIERREDSISPVYQQTYEWIFKPSPDEQKWSSFSAWLQNDEPLYWITGKAGSGKSTLMKFICHDHRTRELLALRNPAPKPYLLSFYFWNSGTPIQMSQEGLIRTFLYQVIRDHPGLGRLLFPPRFEIYAYFGRHVAWREPLLWSELASAFKTFVRDITRQKQLVIFIDGLDEYYDKHGDLLDLIQSFLGRGVKICVSSRPWVVFEDAFKTSPSLKLEHLTQGDMEYYVESKLSANPGFEVLKDFDPCGANDLIDSVSEKASGVFLWTFLVTQSLLEGLSEGERLTDLQRRLDSLPTDLEQLFWKMLKSLDRPHYERASQLFQIKRAFICTSTLITFALADEDDPEAFKMLRPSPIARKFEARAELFRRRLNACTKGLLEPSGYRNRVTPDTVVEYLHRTVRDFIERDDICIELQQATNETFNANFRLCQAYIMKLKMTDPDELRDENLTHEAITAMEYAFRADPDCSGCQETLLDEIDKAATELSTIRLADGGNILAVAGRHHWAQLHRPFYRCTTFLHIAVEAQLVQYVRRKLKTLEVAPIRGESPLKKLATDLLHIAVVYYKSSPFVEEKESSFVHSQPNLELINFLLDHGADLLAEFKLAPQDPSQTILALAPHNSELKALLNKHYEMLRHESRSSSTRKVKNSKIFGIFRSQSC